MSGRGFERIARFALLVLAIGALAMPVGARWRAPTQMPVARLLKTTSDYVKAHPNDAQGYYMLGRINSAAFAREGDTIALYPNEPLPTFPAYEASPVQPRNLTLPLTSTSLTYLRDALRNYHKAVALDKQSAIALLGLGFECEDALQSRETIAVAWEALGLPRAADAEKLRAEALSAYRRAYALAETPDRKLTSGGFSHPISQEAAEGIVRLQKGRKLNAKEQTELKRLQADIKKLAALPRPMTPILISFEPKDHLSDLLAPGARVNFDLSGEEVRRSWPWVKPTTGILVWDPKHTGKIESGLQLFGSVTWWLFWKDGYAPLAALDEDHNGWLEGAELKGISVWFDRNGNGVSDPGEVVSMETLGIRRIAVQAEGKQEGVLWNSRGIELNNGKYAATFDWTPTSEALPLRSASSPGAVR